MRLAIVIMFVLAGCLQTQPDPVAENWSLIALPSGEGHDHTNSTQHQGSSNWEILGHSPMVSDHYGTTAGGYLCGDARDFGDKRLAIVESRSDVAFAVMDVTDPLAPEWLGEMVFPGTRVYDVALMPDGKHALLVTQTANTLAGIPTYRDRCGTVELPIPPVEKSIMVIDLEALEVLQTLPLMGYGHSVMAYPLAGGQNLVMAISLGPDVTSSWVHFYTFGMGDVLVPVGMYRGATPADLDSNVWHDGWIEERDNRLLAHIVGGHNYEILDIENPSQPERILHWSDYVPGWTWTGNLHGVLPYEKNGNYAIIGPEFGGHPEDHPSGVIRILNIDDFNAPIEVAAWTLPHDVNWTGQYMFSNHYYTVQNDTLFVSMYHGGIWAVDLRPIQEGVYLLPSIGVFQPLNASINAAVPVRWAPTTQEVFAFDDGTLLTFDSNTGTYAFKFLGALPAPQPWPILPIKA